MVGRTLTRFERARPFSETEAWALFRLAAFGEAGGWSLLISGILCRRFITPGNNLPVLLAGRIHGILFMLYAAAAIGLYPCLGWKRGRAFVATLASVPPYGSLLFERWAAYGRQQTALQAYTHYLVYTALAN